jgi:hypothetical protein
MNKAEAASIPPLRPSDQSLLIRLADPGQDASIISIDSDALPAILEAADYHRVLPTVLTRLPDETASQISQTFRDRLILDAARMMTLRHTGEQVIAALGEAGLPAVIVKGEHFATRLYPPSIWRPYTDIDILIEESGRTDANTVMRKLGFFRSGSLVKHGGGYGEDKWARSHSGNHLPVELHWDLINSPSLRNKRHLSYNDVVSADGNIDPIGDLLIACVHGALGHTFERLYHVVDIAQSARGVGGSIDPRELAMRARGCGLSEAVAMALAVAGRLFNDESCLNLLERSRLPRPPQWALNLLDPSTLMKKRGSLDLRIAWRRPLVRQWLKRRPAATN